MVKNNILITNPVNHVGDMMPLTQLLFDEPLSKNDLTNIQDDLKRALEFLRQEKVVCGRLSKELVIVHKVCLLTSFRTERLREIEGF